MSKGGLSSARAELLNGERQEIQSRRRCQSQLSEHDHARSPSQNAALPTLTAFCAHCKHPLLIDVNTREASSKSRSSAATRSSQRLCKDCSGNTNQSVRTPSSRLFRSASLDWTDVGDKIETWFEKAKTPDQQVVYKFLEQINGDQSKDAERLAASAEGKSLDDILNNLKKYRERYSGSNSQRNFHRVLESKSWRVMRNPSSVPRQFSRYNPVFGDDASRDFRIGTVFTTTEPRIGSTFLLHPGWV